MLKPNYESKMAAIAQGRIYIRENMKLTNHSVITGHNWLKFIVVLIDNSTHSEC